MEDKPVALNPSQWVDTYGDTLFAYAVARLRDHNAAEEAVQETFLSALKFIDQYRQSGSEGAWLMGILKRKVIDQARAQAKQPAALAEDAAVSALFDKRGNWSKSAKANSRMRLDTLEREEFRVVFQDCLRKLPPTQASTFWLREVQQESAEEVCKALDISTSNLWVLMHRARLALAECMKYRLAMENR
ncbi:MAG: sigma-70 family RNA polymerase sigma factor [Pirellulaceae bacterium]|nr:sigma-70 family RNA polymerase sigma factor [Pirellulaceae bacterium]